MPKDLPADLAPPFIPSSLSKHSINLEAWKERNPTYSDLAVGALIFRFFQSEIKILLVKRASTDSYPNVWEPPGGSVDIEDHSLLAGLYREVWEETGLRVKSVEAQVWDKVFEGEKVEEVTFMGGGGDKWAKLNFLVEVVDGEVELDELEHQDYGWFDRKELQELPLINQQSRDILVNGFELFQKLENGKR